MVSHRSAGHGFQNPVRRVWLGSGTQKYELSKHVVFWCCYYSFGYKRVSRGKNRSKSDPSSFIPLVPAGRTERTDGRTDRTGPTNRTTRPTDDWTNEEKRAGLGVIHSSSISSVGSHCGVFSYKTNRFDLRLWNRRVRFQNLDACRFWMCNPKTGGSVKLHG